ncbi:NRDE family protein [Postechiella marina]|uniref:NRDE family protein n=1 Tax=Postechiella marina TaxID=943941 RepID=A0ABP8CF16_9FLAO
MCTVTIIPKGKNDFILTSNRDEAPDRLSLTPDFYKVDGVDVLFPKDELSGGTWVGVSEKNRVVCLLNGGFTIHNRALNYRLSRGVVVKHFMVAKNIFDALSTYNLEGIEPFTMVIADWNTSLLFFELVWDGQERHVTQLPNVPKIWSSSTLYSKTMASERLSWFNAFKTENELEASAILNFHKTAGKIHKDYGVIMDRGFVKTTSITQITKVNHVVNMRFESLNNNTVTQTEFKQPHVVNE